MAQNATSLPSDHPTTAAALKSKGVSFLAIDGRHPPRDLTGILNEFRQVIVKECRRTTNTDETMYLFGDNGLASLQTALTNEHETELAFDKALFEGLGSCVAGYRVQNCGNNIIMLQTPDDNHKYAVGFARQVRPALDLLPKIHQEKVSTAQSTSGGLEAKSQSDHSVCLCERVGLNQWKVKECFGIIELKMSDTCCGAFKVKNGDGAVLSVDLKSIHGALGQEILYTIGSVVLYQARNGVLRPSVPLAVIAGRMAAQSSSSRLRWVSGLLHAPVVQGDRFTFSVQDFGGFYSRQSNQDIASAALAVRLYLDILLFGLKIAIDVCNIRSAGTIPFPVPASGQFLMIGEKVLENVEFCASPIPGARPISPLWSISQGDLFKGVVNLHEILKQGDISFIDFRSDDEKQNTADIHVLVKVFSTAVHNLLITPLETIATLRDVRLGKQKLVEQIGKVLYAVVRTGSGGITIMSDLRMAGYTTLTPNLDAGNHLTALWTGFKDLVKKVLLPLAEMTIIHPDIRPGYDVTFNILCAWIRNDGTEEVASMRLIDLESLVWIGNWLVPQENDVVDGRFLPRFCDCNAITYVWWQCIFIAYVWKNKILAGDVSKAHVIDILKTVLLDNTIEAEAWPSWLVALRRYTKNPNGVRIDSTCVEHTLNELEGLFTGQ